MSSLAIYTFGKFSFTLIPIMLVTPTIATNRSTVTIFGGMAPSAAFSTSEWTWVVFIYLSASVTNFYFVRAGPSQEREYVLFLIHISHLNYEIADSTVSCFADDT